MGKNLKIVQKPAPHDEILGFSYERRAFSYFFRGFLRFTIEYVAKQRSKAASRSRTGANGEHELGGEFNG